MDSEEAPINWEREAIIYQKALEAALEYQRQLEERIETLKQREREYYELLEEYNDLTARDLEGYVIELKEKIMQLQTRVEILTKSLDQNSARTREYKQEVRAVGELNDELERKMQQQEQLIKQLQAQIAKQNSTINTLRTYRSKEKRAHQELWSEYQALEEHVQRMEEERLQQIPLAEQQEQTIKEQEEEIQQLKQTLQLQQRLLRDRREM